MLTKDLLEVEKYRPNISPRYRDIDEYTSVAQKVIGAYREGLSRGEIEEAVSDLETHDTFKMVRSLSKLLERRSGFEQKTPKPPERIHEELFRRGFVSSQEERKATINNVAEELGISPGQVESGMWADREENEVLSSTPDVAPEGLLRRYNLSLTQTLLFDALELTFTSSGNFQEIFGFMKYLGLMYMVDSDLKVTVTGPAALFKKTRKYGTTLAKLVPSIMKAEEWTLSAQVETEVSGETRVYEFNLDSGKEHLFPERTEPESYDSEVERGFARRISSLAGEWSVKREPTILRAKNRVMIPDFGFERKGHEFYLEVIGFWTPEYLKEKIEKVRKVETEKSMLLAVNENLNCTKEDFEGADQVFFYNRKIPVKQVVDRLHRIESRIVEKDLRTLRNSDIELPVNEEMAIETAAGNEGVEPEAMKRYLKDNRSGLVSSGTFLPPKVVEELKEEIDALGSHTMSDVNPVLERYGIAQDALKQIGYSIQYTSLNQDKATISKD